MAAVNGYSSNYSYGYGYDSYQNSKINSSSWTENAEQAANQYFRELQYGKGHQQRFNIPDGISDSSGGTGGSGSEAADQ